MWREFHGAGVTGVAGGFCEWEDLGEVVFLVSSAPVSTSSLLSYTTAGIITSAVWSNGYFPTAKAVVLDEK